MELIEIEYKGKTLRTSKQGNGSNAMLMLHGFTGSKIDHHRFMVLLANQIEMKDFTVYRIDFLGNGESDGDTSDFYLDSQIDQATVVANYILGIHKSFHLYGFSLGGVVASKLATKLTSQLMSLTLVNPAGNFPNILNVMLKNAIYKQGGYDYLGYYLEDNLIRNYLEYDYFSDLKSTECQVNILYGTKDEFVESKTIQHYRKIYKNVRYIEIVGGDHCFRSVSQTERLLSAFEDLLGGNYEKMGNKR